MMYWELALERSSAQKIPVSALKRKATTIAHSFKESGLGFSVKIGGIGEPEKGFDDAAQVELYIHKVRLRVSREGELNKERGQNRFDYLLNKIRSKLDDGWSLNEPGKDIEVETRPPFVLPELDDKAIARHFSGIYEREPHIRVIHDTVRAFVESDGECRTHVLLYGKPAGCKTTLFNAFKRFYDGESGPERVVFVDGPTMSKAGLENWFIAQASQNALPEIVVVEEIEKQSMDNCLTLLSIMGSGYVMKTNARIGRVRMDTKCMVWATCNDEQLLRNFRNGALWSRFSHRLYSKRPSKQLMKKILYDKTRARKGKAEWAEYAMQFANALSEITQGTADDPREIIGHLVGGDRLIDGSYQKDILAILHSEHEEK